MENSFSPNQLPAYRRPDLWNEYYIVYRGFEVPLDFALQSAVERSDRDFVRRYLADGGDPNHCDLLNTAAEYDRWEIAQMLIDSGADIDQVGWGCGKMMTTTPLQTAAYCGSVNTASVLLRAGASVGCDNLGGSTPLHFAVLMGANPDCRIVEVLMAHGIDVDAEDAPGYTALQAALLGLPSCDDVPGKDRRLRFLEGSLKKARWLIERGANIHARLPDGGTLLHALASSMPIEVIDPRELEWRLDFARRLIEAEIDVDAEDDEGRRAADLGERGEGSAALERMLLSRLLAPGQDQGLEENGLQGFAL